jgi:hypothetical protein
MIERDLFFYTESNDTDTDDEQPLPRFEPSDHNIIPFEDHNDPVYWKNLITLSFQRRLTPVDVWRHVITPRIGIPYPMIDLPTCRNTRSIIASKLRAIGNAIQDYNVKRVHSVQFQRAIVKLLHCEWCTLRRTIEDFEDVLKKL